MIINYTEAKNTRLDWQDPDNSRMLTLLPTAGWDYYTSVVSFPSSQPHNPRPWTERDKRGSVNGGVEVNFLGQEF